MKKLIIALILVLIPTTFAESLSIKQVVRINRIKACEQASKEYQEHIKDKYLINQDFITRCATYMTLVYAYESGYGQSNFCKYNKNCMGMKKPGHKKALVGINIKTTQYRFMVFEKYSDADLVFARLYARFNLNKPINTFVNHWSHTDQGTYINFMKKNYWKIYNEIYLLK